MSNYNVNSQLDNVSLTIVVAVYKVDYDDLKRCLNSLVKQTNQNFEALIIDDGSPDDCGKICDEFADKHCNFRVIHQLNQGLSVVRNNGIKEAKGNWISFLDGDDWVEPNMVEEFISYVNKVSVNADVLLWDEYYDIGGITKKNCFLLEEPESIISFEGKKKEELINLILPRYYRKNRNNFAGIGACHARAYRRTFLIEKQLYNVPGLKRMQDNEFNLWVFDAADLIYYQCKRLYHYTYNLNSATKRYNPEIVENMIHLYRCMSCFIREKRNTNEYWQRLYLKFILLFLQIFELDYGNIDNKAKLREKIKKIKMDFARPEFEEVIKNCDTKGQVFKIRLVHFLLKNRLYIAMILLVKIIVKTRKLRLKSR